jgi:cytochrome c oxidase subunit IV
MSAQASSSEITFHPEHSGGTKRIWTTFWILSGLTILELAIGLIIYNMHKGDHPNATLVLAFKGMVCILTLAKAYYIVSIFMHLGDEVRNMIMTIVVPLCLFIWFITAFLWDGNSWLTLRNRYNRVEPAKKEQVAPAAKEQGAKD